MARHEQFEWDTAKAAANLAKHRVSFEEAAAMLADSFADQFHLEEFDVRHSTADEDRWIMMGSYPFDRSKVYVVAWTAVAGDSGVPVTRIISTRPATRAERKHYDSETQDN